MAWSICLPMVDISVLMPDRLVASCSSGVGPVGVTGAGAVNEVPCSSNAASRPMFC